MKRQWMFLFVGLAILVVKSPECSAKPVKTLQLSESDVGVVRTAIGFTTILNFDAKPTSVVLGDQDSFKVEFVGTGLAIKPLLAGSKTNLFVFTGYDRYSFKLATTGSSDADYLVKVKRLESQNRAGSQGKSPEAAGILSSRRLLNHRASCGGVTLTVNSLAISRIQNSVWIDFGVTFSPALFKARTLEFQPGDFEVIRSGVSVPIERLELTRMAVSQEQNSISGTAVLRKETLGSVGTVHLAFFPDFIKPRHKGCPKVSINLGAAKARPRGTHAPR